MVVTDLASEGMSMIVVTHHLDFVRSVSDRVILMDEGRIVAAGSAEEMLVNPSDPQVQKFIRYSSG